MKQAVVLLAHGTVDDLDELPAFVTRIRHGHAAPPELVAELRRRYESIGGSPLNAINRRLAARVEAALGVTTRAANRLATPLLVDVMRELVASGVERVVEVPLAQYSAHVYAEATQAAAGELARGGAKVAVACAGTWAQEAGLLDAYAAACCEALARVDRAKATLVLSAHSLPVAVIRAGDPYEAELRKSAAGVIDRVTAQLGEVRCAVAFQSQGMSAGPGGRPVEWLGPDLRSTIDAAHARGDESVVFAPIGFLADHVEILYDLDVEARAWVTERGMTFHRTRSLDDGDALVSVIAKVARPLLAA